MSTVKNKETIYIDVDDEITTIIDKVQSSPAKIVALVLPKRAAVLQSVVNMKLLKKASGNAKKNIVLITNESGLLPLAGVAGVHVAKSLQSKPEIPPAPHMASDEDEPKAAQKTKDELDMQAPVGALVAAAQARGTDEETETVDLDNSTVVAASTSNIAKGVKAKLKHLKVPNFDKFRLRFFLGILGVLLLLFGWFMAFVVMPKAKITIKTDTTTVVSSFDFTASAAVTELDIENKKVPATQKEVKKTDNEKAEATGQKDIGAKATGTMTLKNCTDQDGQVVLPAGTRFTANSLTFISDEAISLPESSFSGGSGTCKTDTRTVAVTAESAGDKYNLSSRSYTLSNADIQATGSAMSGGTTNIVKVVSQSDIDEALAKMKSRLDKEAETELTALFDTESLFSLAESKTVTEPKITVTPALDAEATEFTVTSETTYTMLGIKREDLSAIIKKDVESEIDTQRQAITNDGIDLAIMRLNNQLNPGEAFISFRTSVTAGPELDENIIKEAVRGKKRGEIESYVNSQPGVKSVEIEYSPFWVYSTPKAAKKITVVIEKNDQAANDTSNESE